MSIIQGQADAICDFLVAYSEYEKTTEEPVSIYIWYDTYYADVLEPKYIEEMDGE